MSGRGRTREGGFRLTLLEVEDDGAADEEEEEDVLLLPLEDGGVERDDIDSLLAILADLVLEILEEGERDEGGYDETVLIVTSPSLPRCSLSKVELSGEGAEDL